MWFRCGVGVCVVCGRVVGVWVDVIGLLRRQMDMFLRRGAPPRTRMVVPTSLLVGRLCRCVWVGSGAGVVCGGVWVWCRCGVGVV